MRSFWASIQITRSARRVVTAPVDNPTNSINKIISLQSIVHKLLELGYLVSPPNIVALKRFNPVEHPSNPFQCFMLLTVTDGVWLLAEIDVRVSISMTPVICLLAEVIIKLSFSQSMRTGKALVN
jgi:hypothetical protein